MGCNLSVSNNYTPSLYPDETLLLFDLKKKKENGDDFTKLYYKIAPKIRDILRNGNRKDLLYTCELITKLFGDKSLYWLMLSRKPADEIFKNI